MKLKKILTIILLISLFSGCCFIPMPYPVYIDDRNKVYFIVEGPIQIDKENELYIIK